jgi:hypothetical protein
MLEGLKKAMIIIGIISVLTEIIARPVPINTVQLHLYRAYS